MTERKIYCAKCENTLIVCKKNDYQKCKCSNETFVKLTGKKTITYGGNNPFLVTKIQ